MTQPLVPVGTASSSASGSSPTAVVPAHGMTNDQTCATQMQVLRNVECETQRGQGFGSGPGPLDLGGDVSRLAVPLIGGAPVGNGTPRGNRAGSHDHAYATAGAAMIVTMTGGAMFQTEAGERSYYRPTQPCLRGWRVPALVFAVGVVALIVILAAAKKL